MRVLYCVDGYSITPVFGELVPGHDIVRCVPHPDYRFPDDFWHVKGFKTHAEAVEELYRKTERELERSFLNYTQVRKEFPRTGG